MKDIFISFSTKDTDKAMQTCEFLEANGFNCFISTRDLIAGREYAEQLFDNIDDSKMLLLMLSKEANESPHVLRELEYAVRKKVPVLVYSLEEVELSKSMEYYLMTHQWVTQQNNINAKLLEGVSETLKTEKPEEIQTIKKPFPLIPVAVIMLLLLLITVILIPKGKNNIPTETNAETTVAVTTIEATTKAPLTETTVAETTINETTPEATISEEKIYNIGDKVTFGSYYDSAIDWKIIAVGDNGDLTLISQDILCMKAYDAAEGGQV